MKERTFPESSHRRYFFVASADRARGMVGQLISSCWRADKCAKDWMSKQNTKTKQTSKTKRESQVIDGTQEEKEDRRRAVIGSRCL